MKYASGSTKGLRAFIVNLKTCSIDSQPVDSNSSDRFDVLLLICRGNNST